LNEAGKGKNRAVLAALSLGDADAASAEVDLVEADGDEFGDAHADVEQGLDEDDVAAPALFPHRLVVTADLLLGGHVGQALDLDTELGPQVAEDLLQVDSAWSAPCAGRSGRST